MIGNVCREYRLSKNLKLKDVSQDTDIKTLSAFEMGRSSNIKHLSSYILLSIKENEFNLFMSKIATAIVEGEK